MVTKIVPEGATLIPDKAERVFKGVIYDVYHWQQELFDGSESTFEMLRRPDTVSTICIVDDKLLVLQDEQPNRGTRVTFPGGRPVEGEQRLTAAKREVHEETGYEFKNWRLVYVYQPHSKIEHFVYVYVAWEVARTMEPHVDAGERITVELLSFDQAKRLVEEGRDYLGEVRELFAEATKAGDLLNLPEFHGKRVTRP